MSRLSNAVAAACVFCIACSTPKQSPSAQPAPPAIAPSQPVAEQRPANAAQVATTLKLKITQLVLEPDLAPSEPTQSDAGRFLGARFMPSNAGCLGLSSKVQGVYKPTVTPPEELDGDLVYAPGLTLDALTLCFVALGGDRSAVRSLGPAVREFPGFSSDHPAFIDLGHGWLFAAGNADRAVDQLVRVRTP